MKVIKTQFRIQANGNRHVQSALVKLGMPRKRVYANEHDIVGYSFWNRPHYELVDILKDAKDLWRRNIKVSHPDRRGSHACAATLNCLWDRVKTLYKRRGIEL